MISGAARLLPPRSRAFVALAVALGVLGCSTNADDVHAAPLAADQFAAACLVDDAGQHRLPERTVDLCAVSLTGEVRTLRGGIDRRAPVALSPARTRLAYAIDGELWVMRVDGSDETALGVRGHWPVWVGEEELAYISVSRREIRGIAVDGTGPRVLLADENLPQEVDETSMLDSFAVDVRSGQIAVAVRRLRSEPTLDDDQFMLLAQDASDVAPSVVVGPIQEVLSSPSFGADGSLVVATSGGLSLIDLDDGTQTPLQVPGDVAASPTFSPSGDRLIWFGNGDPVGEASGRLFVADVRNGQVRNVRPITETPQPGHPVVVFPDW